MSDEPVRWDFRVHRDNILNSNDRMHWATAKKRKENLRKLGGAQARELPRFERVAMFVEVFYPDRRARDAANLHPTMKSYLDGMVHPENGDGILPDDNDKYVSGPYIDWGEEPSGEKGWFVFRITLVPVPPRIKYRVGWFNLHP